MIPDVLRGIVEGLSGLSEPELSSDRDARRPGHDCYADATMCSGSLCVAEISVRLGFAYGVSVLVVV